MTAAKTTSEFSKLMAGATNTLSLVIKGHHSIENQIQEALTYALPRADGVELRRVAFLLKVDFLIALNVLSLQTRPIFDLVNVIRNRFAHNPYATFDESDGKQVRSLVLAVDPKYPCTGGPEYMLKVLLHVAFDYTSRRYAHLVIERSKTEILNEMMDDPQWHSEIVPGYEELPSIPDEMLHDVQKQMDDEISKRLGVRLSAKHPHISLDK